MFGDIDPRDHRPTIRKSKARSTRPAADIEHPFPRPRLKRPERDLAKRAQKPVEPLRLVRPFETEPPRPVMQSCHFCLSPGAALSYPKPMTGIKHWVFDLDNTLYPPGARLFDQIEDKMERFIMRELSVDLPTARHLRDAFWAEHGTTLAGLMERHGVDPDPFLDEVHEIDLSALAPTPSLGTAIRALEGQRIIYTNGSRGHGENVSGALGLRCAFDGIFGIEDAAYVPKPKREAFERVFDKAEVDPKTAIMFEDDPRNLAIPAELGMVTVLVGSAARPDYVDHQIEDLAGFLTEITTCGFPSR